MATTLAGKEGALPGVPPVPDSPAGVRATLLTYLVLTVGVLIPFLVLVSPYLLSVATGAILAVLCYPVYAKARRRLPAWASGLLVTFGVVVLVLVPACALGVGAFRQGSVAMGQLSSDATPTLDEVVALVRRWVPFLDTLGTPDELRASLKGSITSVSEAASGVVFRQLRAFPVLVLQVVLVVLSIYFFLVDGRRLFHWIGDKLPVSAQIRNLLADSFRSATNSVVLASVAAAGSQALVIFVGFSLLGVPSALLAAGLTFILGWVPALPMVVWGAAAVYLYGQDLLVRAIIMVGIGLVVGVVDNVVRPLVLRGQQSIHPMVSLLAILGGIAFYGVPGVFIGPLVACMAIAVLDIWPSVASYCGIAVSGSGDTVPDVPLPDRSASQLELNPVDRRG